MDDLVEWLRAQLDEDERTARAVRAPHDWHQGPGDDPDWTNSEMVLMWPPEHHTPYEQDKHWRGLTVEGPELAAHIAEWDPARVLREIDAKRRILYLAEHLPQLTATTDLFDNNRDAWREVIKQLAVGYADRPGYREEWRP